jgi:hypothetical protein
MSKAKKIMLRLFTMVITNFILFKNYIFADVIRLDPLEETIIPALGGLALIIFAIIVISIITLIIIYFINKNEKKNDIDNNKDNNIV